ncbi:MAG: hypothetical protein KAQ93_00690 [Spirochaetales bacterium]|nr:hypothetical protein [Spirochaetales bacterium]
MKKQLILIVFIFAGLTLLFADSPLTSTPFYKAYSEINLIKEARVKGTLNLEMAEYLSSGSVSLDLKAALINALSWDIAGKNNSELYRYYLGLKYGVLLEEIQVSRLLPFEIFSLGYLQAMDNYFNVRDSLNLLELAIEDLDKSLIANLVYLLVKTQGMMQSQNWNEIWPLFDSLINDETLLVDIRPEAVNIIIDYMVLYR